jgi:alkylation response protein AidB-like acyl-CoA dehydrogenase
MISFQPSEEQQLIQQSVADFAKSTMLPRVRELEKNRGVPEDIRKGAHEMGLGLMSLPEACGGQGLGCVASALVDEELGAADAGASFGLPGPGAFGRAVLELGTEAQAAELLADFAGEGGHGRFGGVAWSEPSPSKERAGFSTVATKVDGGYTLRGKKAFVMNAHTADRFLVFAQVEPEKGWAGIGAFVVRKDNPGLEIGARHDTLGLDAADFGEIALEDAKVSEADRLLGEAGGFTQATLRFFAKQALVVAARAVGVARFAFEIAREHCDTRKAFGKPIGHFQAVAFALADRHMDVESSRWLVWKAAHAWDAKLPEKDALVATAQAAAHALEACMRTTDDCVGLHGGSGFIRDLIAEKLMRDSKQLALCCPTAEQLDQIAAALDLGVPLDPALVLPTPDTQAIFT